MAVKKTTILAWDDDPASVAKAKPARRPPATLSRLKLPVAISGKAPKAGAYAVGSDEFRHWTAADALARAVRFWAPLAPKRTKWQTGPKLPVHLNAGSDLNAYYARGGFDYEPGLSFFHYVVAGQDVYSGESPDIATHELGHAMLDAIRPELWDAASVEAASFHESFGDISAVLSGLQIPELREAVLRDTDRRIHRSSRVSRLAEQMGWAVRQLDPGAAEADCLRNAVNNFFYRDPDLLPPTSPATQLSSEPHSFSRVFTGAFVEMLAGMFLIRGDLEAAARDAGQILVDAIVAAPIVPNYFRQIATYCIRADEKRFAKKYRSVIHGGFVRRGILPLGFPKRVIGGGVRLRVIRGRSYGLSEPLMVLAPEQHAAESFLDDLIQRGRVDMRAARGNESAMVVQPFIRKTHIMVREGGKLVLRRRMFDCGFE